MMFITAWKIFIFKGSQAFSVMCEGRFGTGMYLACDNNRMKRFEGKHGCGRGHGHTYPRVTMPFFANRASWLCCNRNAWIGHLDNFHWESHRACARGTKQLVLVSD